MKTEQMDWWKETEEESCILETILFEMMWENGHGGLGGDGEREGDGVMKAH